MQNHPSKIVLQERKDGPSTGWRESTTELDIVGISSGYCCTNALNLGLKNKGEDVSKVELLIKLVVVKRLKWGGLKVGDSQEARLRKYGADWGINKECDEILIGERYKKDREQLTSSPRMFEKKSVLKQATRK